MERGEAVLVHGLDGHGKNLLVPVGLEQRFGVGAVVLAPASIGPHEVRWEQDDVVSQPSETSLPRSEQSRRLREARWQRSVWQKTTPTWVDSHGVAWTPSPLLPRWQSRRRSLQDPQRSSYLSFGLLLFDAYSTDFGTSMPSMSAEESIPSLDDGSTPRGRIHWSKG